MCQKIDIRFLLFYWLFVKFFPRPSSLFWLSILLPFLLFQFGFMALSLQETVVHSSVIIYSLVLTYIFKLFPSVLKLMNIRLYLLVSAWHQQIYEPSDLTLSGPIYSSVDPHNWWIYMVYIRRFGHVTDEYRERTVDRHDPPIFVGFVG
jgi:hypothetical protein